MHARSSLLDFARRADGALADLWIRYAIDRGLYQLCRCGGDQDLGIALRPVATDYARGRVALPSRPGQTTWTQLDEQPKFAVAGHSSSA